MEFINSTVNYDGFEDKVVICKVKAPEVDSIIKDFEKCLKENLPGWSFQRFVLVNFWNPDEDYYYLPDIIQCSNKNVAIRLYSKLLHHLEYHDTMKQSYCTVNRKDNKIFITCGDY